MTEPTQKPVIFLAFAQDRVEGGAYLRNLPIELDGIRKALQKARQAGLGEVVERSNTTVENILDVFQEYQDRIAIFHYGGHADSYELLLESLTGEHAMAHSEGLVSFLAKQKGLQLVFLNGCCSQQQALDLIEAGVPAVVGTSQKIDDEIATNLSGRFYKGLAVGLSIDRAWAEAVDQVKVEKGTSNTRALHWKGKVEASDRFPWEIYYRQGAEIVKDWNLPEAVENPLFGLPEIPKTYDLPETPFLFLKRYERQHAEIFFGRSYYIRDLYNRVSDPNSPPVILLYGQSGVGKSSLFDAGLNPRLEKDYKVIYIRRIQEKGLAGTLEFALEQELANFAEAAYTESEQSPPVGAAVDAQTLHGLEVLANEAQEKVREEIEALIQRLRSTSAATHKEQPSAVIRQPSSSDQQPVPAILQQWQQIEASTGKPLLVILDQVEELYTRPDPQQPEELEKFLTMLQLLFGSPSERPQGKLLLGYRKEYHPEIEEGFRAHRLPRATLFLESLRKKDILEVFHGLTRTPALKARYNLTVEDELPVMIADDLLDDKDSPVAPVLQIVLTKLWNAAIRENPTAPRFTVEQYQQLKKDGIAMGEFFAQQMEQLRTWQPEVVDSGLALDVLHLHITALGTAGSRSLEELRETYQHRQDIIDALIAKCKELYLLTEAPHSAAHTGLTHDTLAPVVAKEYNTSDRSGQRAARILNSKMGDFRENGKVWLDEADLAGVERGAAGMRRLTAKEIQLLKISQARRRRNRALRYAALAVIVILGAFGWWQQRVAEKQKSEAQRQLALNYWENSRTARDQHHTLQARLALHLAAAAIRLSTDEALISDILLDIDRSAWLDIYGSQYVLKPLMPKIFQHDAAIKGAKLSRDGKRILTWSDDSTARLWLAETGSQIGQSMKHNGEISGAAFDQAEKNILTWSGDVSATVRLWQAKTGRQIGQSMKHDSPVWGAVFDQAGRRILTWGGDGTARVWQAETGKQIGQNMKHDYDYGVKGAAFDQAGKHILTWSTDSTARLWQAEICTQIGPDMKHNNIVNGAVFDQAGKRILTWDGDGTARLWQTETGRQIGQSIKHDDGSINGAMFDQAGKRILIWGTDHTARLWQAETGRQIGQTMKHDYGSVYGAVFDQAGQRILTWGSDHTARVWQAETGRQIGQSMKHDDEVSGAVFDQAEKRILTWSIGDSTARLWQAETGKQLGMSMKHGAGVLGAVFDQAGKRILTWSKDGTARLYDIEVDLDFPAKDYTIEVQVLTHSAFNESAKDIESLDGDAWHPVYNEYLQLARKHYQVCRYPRANRYRQLYPEEAAKIRTLDE